MNNTKYLLLSLIVASGCGDDGTNLTLPDLSDYEAEQGEPLSLVGSRACALDTDCADDQICFQAICGQTSEIVLKVVPGLSITKEPARIQTVAPGQSEHLVTFRLSGNIPDGGLAYRIERSDDPDASAVVLVATGTGDEVSISVSTGLADSNQEGSGDPVYITLVTAAGSVRQTLIPEFAHEGTYGGEIVIETFGQVGLPIELSIVTDPVGATLAEADSAYLVLPVIEGNLWNPLRVESGGPTHVARELVFDAFVGGYVARFDTSYTFENDGIFAWVQAGGNEVVRSLRFELIEGESGVFLGRVSDLWSGFFEARSSGGVIQSKTVRYQGTLFLQRMDAAPALADVTPLVDYPIEPLSSLPSPDTVDCSGTDFNVTINVDGLDRDCVGIADATAFASAIPSAQASCAIAIGEVALTGNTTASQIVDFLDEATPNPGGQSFSDFMDDCATQSNGTCQPIADVLCARQLSAIAIRGAEPASLDMSSMLDVYQRTSREAFLGNQFAAFYSDALTRLDWLKAQDFPAVVTSAVQSFVAALLESWQVSVLDVHMAVLAGHLDPAGGAALGQELTGMEDALNQQRTLLLEISQSWRAAADGVSLGATRWNSLLTDANDRTEKTSYVYGRTLDLYLAAGVLAELNRSAGVGANNAIFAGGFRTILQEVNQLAQPFDQLLNERQGEVVVSTSLDPTAGNAAILASLEADAMSEISLASQSVTDVIADSQAELLKQVELTSRIASEAADLELQLAELCGLPTGCTQPNQSDCAPRVNSGECGFVTDSAGVVLDASPGSATPSEAGAAILEVQSALLELRRAEEVLRAHYAQTELLYQTTDSFATQVGNWNDQRSLLLASVTAELANLQTSSDATLAAMATNIAGQLATRQNRISEQEMFVSDWDKTTSDGITDDFSDQITILRLRGASDATAAAADFIDAQAKAAKEGLPKSTGVSNDVTSIQRMAILLHNNWVASGMRLAAAATNSVASKIELLREQTIAKREADLTVLEFTDEVAAASAAADVEFMRNQFDLLTTASEAEQRITAELIENMERDVEFALAYERDLVELRDRRDSVHLRIIEGDEITIQVTQAHLAVDQAMQSYNRSVLRAQLRQGRLALVRNQLQNVNQLIGSPAAVFAWANQLSRAEGRLERAKAATMDWVVGLEFFAVRPFFDSRIQILLARNTTQLEEIATDLKRIQNNCGGAINTQIVEVSVREDLLGIKYDILDLRTGLPLTPAERFREILIAGNVPIDKRVRYRSDASIGDLLNRSGILALSFSLGLDAFANLDTTCNAKLSNLSIQIVGDKLGTALPTVSLLYDGTSSLRSCQPDVQAIVDLIGAEATPFGEVTQFKTPGRSVSPIAGINEFPSSNNETLGGLPLASQYTVLIDPSGGENANIDWTKLDDIKLRLEYDYQDLFPAGQCQ